MFNQDEEKIKKAFENKDWSEIKSNDYSYHHGERYRS